LEKRASATLLLSLWASFPSTHLDRILRNARIGGVLMLILVCVSLQVF
jgi:hypothetical protein